MKDAIHFRQDFHSVAWVIPGMMLGGQNFNFLNMVMCHIKLKEMISRPGYNENFLPLDQTGDLEAGPKGQVIRFLREHGNLRWHAIE